MKQKVVIITGANRGLGKAIADTVLALNDARVISISRSVADDHEYLDSDSFIFLKTDLSEDRGTAFLHVLEKYISIETEVYFFNNAGSILPISNAGNFTSEEIKVSVQLNVISPVYIITHLLKTFRMRKMKFINITSGAAHRPIGGWALYSGAKAYLDMFLKVLQEEYSGVGSVKFYSIDPGVVDTGMQSAIRSSKFAGRDYFQALHDNDELVSPAEAATSILDQVEYSR